MTTLKPLALPLLTALLGVAAANGPAHAQQGTRAQDRIVVHAENPLQVERADEVISLPWSTLRERVPAIRPDRVRVVDVATGAELVTQVLDENADGQPDALLVLASFRPGGARVFAVEPVAASTAARARAYARYYAPRDDVAWETDRIAFRMYGQGLWNAAEYQPLVSSGIDVWLKRVPDLIVDRWYEKGHDAYHIDTGEGADFYTVGPTLGAGGSAIWRDGQLYRAENFKTHRILANGPIRTIFELQYEPWDAAGVHVSETKRITMDAGQQLFRQDITYSAPGAAPLEYAVGTVKRAGLVGTTSAARSWAWQSTWGPVELKNGGHGSLGTAVLMERRRVLAMRETDDHYVTLGTARSGEVVTQYAGASWTASGHIPDVTAWWDHLDRFAQRLEHPIRVVLR